MREIWHGANKDVALKRPSQCRQRVQTGSHLTRINRWPGINPNTKETQMKHFLSILFAAITLLVAASAYANDVGVGLSVSVGQPGFYGHIDIGNFPQPEIIYPQPVVIQPPAGIVAQPVYMHVPPGQVKKWHKYCGRYNACGRPVYFVRDSWYNDVYVPQYRKHHRHQEGIKGGKHGGKGHGRGHEGHGRSHDRGHDRG